MAPVRRLQHNAVAASSNRPAGNSVAQADENTAPMAASNDPSGSVLQKRPRSAQDTAVPGTAPKRRSPNFSGDEVREFLLLAKEKQDEEVERVTGAKGIMRAQPSMERIFTAVAAELPGMGTPQPFPQRTWQELETKFHNEKNNYKKFVEGKWDTGKGGRDESFWTAHGNLWDDNEAVNPSILLSSRNGYGGRAAHDIRDDSSAPQLTENADPDSTLSEKLDESFETEDVRVPHPVATTGSQTPEPVPVVPVVPAVVPASSSKPTPSAVSTTAAARLAASEAKSKERVQIGKSLGDKFTAADETKRLEIELRREQMEIQRTVEIRKMEMYEIHMRLQAEERKRKEELEAEDRKRKEQIEAEERQQQREDRQQQREFMAMLFQTMSARQDSR